MSTIVEKLAASGHLTPKQIERIGTSVAEFLSAVDSDPSLMKEAMEKLSFLEEVKEYAPKVLYPLALSAAIGGGATIAHDVYSDIKHSVMKARNYKRMLEANPQLKDIPPEQVQAAFNTLHKFNPEYASDPMVAGAFIKTTAGLERMGIGDIHGLVKARSDMVSTRNASRIFNPQKMVGMPNVPFGVDQIKPLVKGQAAQSQATPDSTPVE
jgi:hypothetical protein